MLPVSRPTDGVPAVIGGVTVISDTENTPSMLLSEISIPSASPPSVEISSRNIGRRFLETPEATFSYRIRKIKKKSGKFRTIVCPDREFKSHLRNLCGKLHRYQEKLCDGSVIHGFARGKSPVTMANNHIGHEYTISFDLEDFFNYVNEIKLKNKISSKILDYCLVSIDDSDNKIAAQGLPTSPMLANIAASDLDKAILKFIKKHQMNVVYTRYADDLTFSFDDLNIKSLILKSIPEIVSRSGFKINNSKTRFLPQRAGNRLVCGVMVGDKGISITRAQKKRIRAIQHKLKFDKENKDLIFQIRGLHEWRKLKEPSPILSMEDALKIEDSQRIADVLCKGWKLKKVKLKHTTQNEIDGNFILTNDPAYILGMSSYTTGWTSCMRFGRSHFGGVVFWLNMNSRIAAKLDDDTLVYHGIERRKMICRAIIHTFPDGQMAYDRIYGNQIDDLKIWLESRNIIPISKVPRGKLLGYFPKNGRKPYFDSLKSSVVLMKNKTKKLKITT